MKSKLLSCFLLIGNVGVVLAQSQPTLPYQQFSVGVDYRALKGKCVDTSSFQGLQTKLFGISAQFESSFIIGSLSKKKRRFLVGDLLHSQLGLGYYQTNNRDIQSAILPYYLFEFGLRSIFKINANNDLGADLLLLSFGRDRVSPNTSGSAAMLRYRYKRHIVAVGVKARRDRIFGWLQQYISNRLLIPPQYICSYSYLFKSCIIGLNLDYMYDKQYSYTQFNINPLYNYNIRLFYGICF